MSKRDKLEWSYYINPKSRRRQYNALCRDCVRDCKQSYRMTIIECRNYASKRDVDSSSEKSGD
jgi:hypothetical protein